MTEGRLSGTEGKLNSLRKAVAEDAGAPEFVELAALLGESAATRAEARELCFKGLSKDPANLQGRLVLARLFYLDEMAEFAVRELVVLRKQQHVPALDRLIESFGELGRALMNESSGPAADITSAQESVGVVAEVDLEADFLEALDELEGDE